MARYSAVGEDRKANLLLAAQGDVPSMIVTYPTCTIANGIGDSQWNTGSEEMCGPFKGNIQPPCFWCLVSSVPLCRCEGGGDLARVF